MKFTEWVIVICVAILIAVLLLLFVWFINVDAQINAPTWAAYSCDDQAWIHITWTDPPPQVTPFDTINKGHFFVGHSYYLDSYEWQYFWWEIIGGHSVFNWAGYYDKPDEPFYLEGWVHSMNSVNYWIYPDRFYPICENKMYLPIVRKK